MVLHLRWLCTIGRDTRGGILQAHPIIENSPSIRALDTSVHHRSMDDFFLAFKIVSIRPVARDELFSSSYEDEHVVILTV